MLKTGFIVYTICNTHATVYPNNQSCMYPIDIYRDISDVCIRTVSYELSFQKIYLVSPFLSKEAIKYLNIVCYVLKTAV